MQASLDQRLSTGNRVAAYVQGLWRQPRTFNHVVTFWFLLLAMAAVRCSVAMYGSRIYSLDGFLVLDGAWRMLNGQRPHVDFNSMVGPAAYLPTLLGFFFASNTAAGFGYGQAMVGLVLGTWAYLLGRKLYETPRILYALCVAAVAVSPTQLGLSPIAFSPATTYNRYAYALLGVLLLECLSTEVDSEILAGFSSGAVIAILAFLKITGFLGGVLLIVALIPQRKQTLPRWVGLAAGAALVGFPFLYYLHFDVGAVIRDLAITAGAKRVVTDIYLLNSIARDAAIALMLTLVASWCLTESGKPQGARRVLLAGVVVVPASVLLIFGNYQPSELPLLALFLLIISHRLLVNWVAASSLAKTMSSLVLGGSAIYAGITVLSALLSLAGAQWVKMHSARAADRFQGPALRQFVIVKGDAGYTNYVNNGFGLLQQHRKPGERVMSLDFTNPFSYGLWIPPAPGGSTNLQYNGSFNAQHKVSPERLFGAADLVMVPKSFADQSLQNTVPSIYGPYLEAHFHLIAESWSWKLYRRRASAAPDVGSLFGPTRKSDR